MPYYLSPKISYKTFKLLNKKLYPKPDIKPMHIDVILWQLLRDRKINIRIDDSDDPVQITTKNIPKGAKIIV